MAKRRPSGDGMVRKKDDGRWEGRIVVGHKENGDPIFRYVYGKTQKELLSKLHQRIEQFTDVELTEDSRLTLAEWLDKWLTEYMPGTIRDGTLRGYKMYARNYVNPYIGKKIVSQVTSFDFQKLYTKLRKQGRLHPHPEYGNSLADATICRVHSILKTVEAKYVYGLSATPVRQDGHQPIIFMQCGPVRYLVDAKSQAEKRVFSHYVFPRFTRTRLPDAKHIQDVYAGIVDNDTRNGLIVADALKLLSEGRTPILLTERKEHALQLANLLEGKAQHLFLMVGSDSQKEKREKLAALRVVPPQESLVVVATGKYIGEGFDEPRLDTMLLAMPISWKGTLAQYAGRLHRNYDGKQEVRIYDYVDVHIPMLERMYHKRLRGYAELGYQVKLGEQETSTSKLYNGQNYLTDYMEDISGAVRSILIVSPYLQKNRISGLLPAMKCSLSSGTRITIYTRPAECYKPDQQAGISAAISMLEDAEITVITRNDIQQRYAIVDQSIVWYGSIDFLAFGGKDADALRFENAEIAGELLDVLSELTEQ